MLFAWLLEALGSALRECGWSCGKEKAFEFEKAPNPAFCIILPLRSSFSSAPCRPRVGNHRHSLLEADELSAFELVRFDSDRRQLHSVNVMSKSNRYRFLVEADLALDESVDAVEGFAS